jgi:hypothetical protein
MITKTCTDCNQELPATSEFFHKKKTGRYGLRAKCRACRKKRDKKRYEEHGEKIRMQSNMWRKQNHEKAREIKRGWQRRNRERLREYEKNRYHKDPTVRIAQNIRTGIRRAINGTHKSSSSMELLGCTPEECKKYLESKFQEGMSWDNYGNPNGDHSDCWHIDHIRPCASFDLTDPEQQRQCFHYTNLQPLWAVDNLSKGAKDVWNN